MSESRRGRPPHRFAIRRVRLVNFHNLVDETIEIRDAGHLFLLGDNGSGKTTVLDAIHLALTGSLEVELNAAARIAGGRDAGRTLQGIVLRLDAERGVGNEGGAIAYSVLELFDETEGAVLCAGVGIEATTMDADVNRWGVLHRGPLEAVPLVEERPEGRLPATRESLRDALGRADVPARMTEYRKLLAERLFGGETLYEEVCRFWKMAKAYREIVAGARDFASLFFRLLPAPDEEVYGDILRSLHALDELDGLVEQLERQRRYAAEVAALVDEIRGHRQDVARYGWLLTFRRTAELRAELGRALDGAAASTLELERLAADVTVRESDLDLARQELRAADARDPDGMLVRLHGAQALLGRAEGDVQRADAATRALDAEAARLDAQARGAFVARCALWRARAERLDAAAVAVRSVEHPLGAVLALAGAERSHAVASFVAEPPPPLPAIHREAEEQAERVLSAERSRVDACREDVARRRHELERARNDVDDLSARAEETPAVAGFAQARSALAAAGLEATPLFELLDPQAGAAEGDLGTLESLLGDGALATFLAAPSNLAAVRARALPHDGARVVVRDAEDAVLPAWVERLFSKRTPPQALRALATLLSQAPSLGEPAPPDALGDTEHRGAAIRPGGSQPRLLGAEARRRAHDERLRGARERLRGAEAAHDSAVMAYQATAQGVAAASELLHALGALRDRELLEAHAALQHRMLERSHASELAQEARTRAEETARRRSELLAGVEALRAQVRGAGIEELERHLDRLRERERAAVDAHREALTLEASKRAELDTARRGVSALENRIGDLGAALASNAGRLRAVLGKSEAELDDDALERHVRIEKRGDQFRSEPAIESALRDADRHEGAGCREIEGDGSRGVSNIEWAGRFGLTWFGDELRVEDRRGESLASVLADLEKRLVEQREVVNEKTRELMDRLVMGDLARELQDQVERLHRTVREMNDLLEGLRFGTTRYQFKVTPRADAAELVGLVRKLSVLDETSRRRFREFVDARLDEVRQLDRGADVPELLDYRRWFDYRLSMRSTGGDDTELTRELRALGSGGEQGVPNYLLVLALAKLMFDNAGARVRPLLFDEAFYGIDAGRRDQLLRFATELGIQLVVASPDQDGVSPSARRTTTLFLVKDPQGDVHLAPYHYWNDSSVTQTALFNERPVEPNPSEAVCAVGEGRS